MIVLMRSCFAKARATARMLSATSPPLPPPPVVKPMGLLHYTYCMDMAARRGPHRAAHLAHARAAAGRGELLLGGATAEVDAGYLVFTTEGGARSFAEADPYVHARLVDAWAVRTWNVVVGSVYDSIP